MLGLGNQDPVTPGQWRIRCVYEIGTGTECPPFSAKQYDFDFRVSGYVGKVLPKLGAHGIR